MSVRFPELQIFVEIFCTNLQSPIWSHHVGYFQGTATLEPSTITPTHSWAIWWPVSTYCWLFQPACTILVAPYTWLLIMTWASAVLSRLISRLLPKGKSCLIFQFSTKWSSVYRVCAPSWGGGGRYFLKRGWWGCAAGWGRIFNRVTRMGSHIFWILWQDSSSYLRFATVPECLYCWWKENCSFLNIRQYINRKWLSWDRENNIFPQKWLRRNL